MSIDSNKSDVNFDELLEKIDADGNGEIEYSEFLAHTLSSKQLNDKNLYSFFNSMIPHDQAEAYLNAQIIKDYLEKCGHKYELEEIKDKISQCGEALGMKSLSGDQNIEY